MNKNIYTYIEKNWVVILAILIFITYIQTLTFNLTYCDDHEIILNNYERISTTDNIGKEFFHGYIGTDYYRPMINLSFLFNAQIAGQDPLLYHFANILFHIIFSISLVIFFKKLKIPFLSSFILTVIFAVHPLNTNAVAWIVGRNDTIFAIFAIWSFIKFIDFIESDDNKNIIYHAILLLLAYLSKESALLIPLILLSYILLIAKVKIITKNNLLLSLSWIITYLLWFGFRSFAVLGESVNRMGLDIFLMNLKVLPEFIAKFFLPINLSVLATYSNFNTYLGIFVIIIIIALVFSNRNINKSKVLFGLILFLILLLPSLFVNIKNSEDWNEYVECRSYLPIIGLLIISYEIFKVHYSKLLKKQWFNFAIILVALFIVLTNLESSNYKNSITFYESAIKDDPSRSLFHFVISRHYRNNGRIDKEEEQLLQAYNLKNTYAKYPYNLGVFYYNHSNPTKAISYFNQAIKLDSLHYNAYKSLASTYLSMGNLDSAISILKIAIPKFDDNNDLILNLGMAYAYKKDFDALNNFLNSFVLEDATKEKLLEQIKK